MYRYKYEKYKNKYLQSKYNNKSDFIGGGSIDGYYYKNNIQYKTFKTDENKYISYYEENINTINDTDITKELKKPNPTKILVIDNIDSFNHFTNKYGQYGKDLETIYIQWDRVLNDYKGFYLDQTNNNLIIQRHQYAYYKQYRLDSWWSYEYKPYGVMIFDK